MRIAMIVPDNRDEFRRYSDPEPYFGPAPTALLGALAARSDCEIHVVCCTHQALRSPAKLARNIFYHSLPVPKWGWLRGAYIFCVRAVKKKLLEIRPDLVHGQGTERYCSLAAAFSNYPSVLTIHGNMRRQAKMNRPFPFSYLWLAAKFERVAIARSCGVFCNSAHTQRQVQGLARRTWLVPNALDEAFFAPPTSAPLRSPPLLLNVGTILPNKRQIWVLDVAEGLCRQGARFELHFLGQLDERTGYGLQFRQRIAAAEEQGFAKFVGMKSPAELVKIMDSASALIHAPEEEAFGLVVAEALARNLKFFGTRVGGLTDITAGVGEAELFSFGDNVALSSALLNWLSKGGPRIAEGATLMRQRYHPSIIAERHVAIYRELLANPCGRI
ncbi:MAG: glycosyltransferase family 4 protein [Limisphaerales bacterium]